MKFLFSRWEPARAFADYHGTCLVELEKEDTYENVVKELTKEKPFYETQFVNPKRFTEYENYKGNLILFDTVSSYLD